MQNNSTLSGEQREALQKIEAWLSSEHPKPVFRVFGPAGTGKTTLAREVAAMAGAPHYAAYTGKAVHVLRQKGCVPAATLHSLIYRPAGADHSEAIAEIDKQLKAKPDDAVLLAERARLVAAERELHWVLNDQGLLAMGEVGLLICDEVSMVNDEMAADLLSFGVPLLVLGDPEQLPPIRGEGAFTRAEPDVMLTQIHRQAEASPVLELATRVRLGGRLRPGETVHTGLGELACADQVLVGTNRTRWKLIAALRARAGAMYGWPGPGDRVICLQNNRKLGVFNGQQFEVLDMRPVPRRLVFELDVRDDLGDERTLRAFSAGFAGQAGQDSLKRQGFSGDVAVLTFAQAITVHKAQGSEWGSVALADESGAFTRHDPDQGRRWLYTGITRASETLTIFSPSAIR